MTWLMRLKTKNAPGTDATNATKTVFVVFVAYPVGYFAEITKGEAWSG